MHAYEIPGLRFSLPAGENITRRRFLNVNSASAAVYASAGGAAIGVSLDDAPSGTAATLADGIVMLEAGAAITAGSQVEVGASGKAITKNTGIGVGVAITGAGAAGLPIAVKLVSVSAEDGANGNDVQTFVYTAENPAAGADLSDIPIGVAVGAGTISKVSIISLGAAAGVDDANSSVFALKVGATSKANKSFNTAVAFPASGAAADMTITSAAVVEDDVLLLSVTNGATADLPAFMVQVVVTLD